MLKSNEREANYYCNLIKKIPLLTREEENKLARKAQAGDKKAMDRLVEGNLRFVVRQAHKYAGYLKHSKITFHDLIQEGNVGLMIAAHKFDPDRGFKLITYALWWINVRMSQLAMNNYSLLKIGTTVDQRKLFSNADRVTDIWNEDNPEEKEKLREQAIKDLRVKRKSLLEMEHRLYNKDASIHACVGGVEDPTLTLEGVIEESHPWADYLNVHYNRECAHKAITKAIKVLNPQEKDIIQERYLGEEKITLQKLGNDRNLSRERIRQIESNAFKKMQQVLNKESLTPF